MFFDGDDSRDWDYEMDLTGGLASDRRSPSTASFEPGFGPGPRVRTESPDTPFQEKAMEAYEAGDWQDINETIAEMGA
jgi:hypothetical protein